MKTMAKRLSIIKEARAAQPRAKKSLGLKPPTWSAVRPARRKAARLGQNFLKHPQIAERIVQVAGVQKTDTVLEVGPGRGILTRALLAVGARVVAVEADGALVEELRETFAPEITARALELVHGDIRAFDETKLPREYKVVANIPYYLTGELMRQLLESARQPASITFLVQKEVAERIARAKKESLLSLSVKAFGTPKYEFTVPRGAFTPAPNVDSAVLTIRDISRAGFAGAREESRFFELIHAGFAHKRKVLRSNLEAAGYPRALVAEALSRADLAPDIRAEDLILPDWLHLVRALR